MFGDQQLSAQQVGNALYGLNGQKDTEAVQLVLRALAPKIKQCDEQLNAQHVPRIGFLHSERVREAKA